MCLYAPFVQPVLEGLLFGPVGGVVGYEVGSDVFGVRWEVCPEQGIPLCTRALVTHTVVVHGFAVVLV